MLVYWVEWRQMTMYKRTVRTWCMARTRRKHLGFISSTSSPSTGHLDTWALQHMCKRVNDGSRGVQWVLSIEQVTVWKAISRSILFIKKKKRKMLGIQKESTFNLFFPGLVASIILLMLALNTIQEPLPVTWAWPKLCPQGLPWWSSG